MADLQHLLESLQTVKNNYALAQAGIALMTFPDAEERLKVAFGAVADKEESASFNYISYVFRDDELLKLATSQLRNATLRNCLKETFEIVSIHAEQTGQLPTLKRASWYQFLRIIRNCLSHDFILTFTTADRKHLPVNWSSLTIDASMAGKHIPMRGFLTRLKALELIEEVRSYVKREFA
jgi:hypothetical protein